MNILCLFVRYGTTAYPDALAKLDAWYERNGLQSQRTLWIIDNQLPPETPPQLLAPGVELRAGDNSCGEFSAWQRALGEARNAQVKCDLVHFVTSAFNVLFTSYLDFFHPKMIGYVAARNVCLGHIDRYDAPVKLEGTTLRNWIRTCFFFLSAESALALEPWAAFRDPARFFATPTTCKFKTNAPLSSGYRNRITAWLSGENMGGHVWHSAIRPGQGGQTARFQQKTLAILNEHRLAVTLRQRGIPLADFCSLWSHRASPVEEWPAPPSESAQIEARNQQLWGRLPKDCLPEILRELEHLPDCRGQGRLRLERVRTNPQRIDHRSRLKLRVFREDRCLCFLTVGYNLTDLWARTKAFAEACPAIACKALFRHQAGLLDYVGVECFEGLPLEEAVQSGRITEQAVDRIVAGVVSELNRTIRPSTEELAIREFDELAGSMASLPFLNKLDRELVQAQIIPFIKKRVLTGPWHIRWTNGDLIPANVLVSDQGAARLIDYEFAAPTHFPADDWWRWRTFSQLPDTVRTLPSTAGSPNPDARGFEALFIIKHLVLTNKVIPPGRIPEVVRDQVRRLTQIVATEKDSLSGSFLLRPLIESDNLLPELQGKLAFLEPEIDARLKELRSLYASTEALRNERNLLQAQLADLQKNFAGAEQDRIERGKVIEAQSHKFTKLEGEFDARLKELKSLYASAEDLKNERNLLLAQLADLQANFAATEKDRNDRGKLIEAQGKKLTELEDQFDTRLKELKALYTSAEDLKNERNLLSAQLADLLQNFAAAEKDRNDRGKVIDQQGKQISELHRLVWLTEQNRDWWKAEAGRVQETADAHLENEKRLAAERQQLETQLAAADVARSMLQGELDRLRRNWPIRLVEWLGRRRGP